MSKILTENFLKASENFQKLSDFLGKTHWEFYDFFLKILQKNLPIAIWIYYL